MIMLLARFAREDAGSVNIEYSMIALLIAVGIITALTQIGTSTASSFTTASNALK
jgi:pilus assembly protein Flp/PilA